MHGGNERFRRQTIDSHQTSVKSSRFRFGSVHLNLEVAGGVTDGAATQ
jgi:hypothetical protein